MTLTETFALVTIIISLVGLVVTVVHDTIDIMLKLAELQNKNGQKK